MPKYSISDVQTYSADDIATGPPAPKPPASSWLSRLAPPMKEQGDYGLPGVGMTQEGLRREGERLGAAGSEVAAGAKQAVTGEGAGRSKGASRVIRGAFSGAGPYLGGAMGIAAPLATAYSLPVGMAMDYATEKGLKAVGVPEGPAELVSDVAGMLAPVPGLRRIMRPPPGPLPRGVAGESRVAAPAVSGIGEPMGPYPSGRPLPPPPLPPPPPDYLPGLAQRKAQAQTGLPIPSGVFRGKQTPLERTLDMEIGDVSPLVPSGIAKASDLRRPPAPVSEPSPFADAVLPNRLRAKMPPRPGAKPPAQTYRAEDVAIAPEPIKAAVPEPPARQPIGDVEPLDAGPVPKGPKSAAESAAILARENPPVFKSARESAEVFKQGESTPVRPTNESATISANARPEPEKLDAGGSGEGPAIQERAPRRSGAGRTTKISIPGEAKKVEARYEVRELSDVVPSHFGDSFQANPRYQLKNERNYSDPSNQERVVKFSSKEEFDPAYLITDNPDLVNGPPAIDEFGNIIGGNSRGMILNRVHGAADERSASYRKMLEDNADRFGISRDDLATMKQPILLRVIPDESLRAVAGDVDAGKKALVRATNKTGTADLTPAERATADARALDPDALESVQQIIEAAGEGKTVRGVLGDKEGAQILNLLVDRGVITTQEKPSLVDARTGTLTSAAKDRIEQMMLGRLFRDSEQFQRTPSDLREKLTKVAGPLARIHGKEGWDITKDLQDALDLVEYARAHDVKNLNDLVAQQGMFGEADAPQYSQQAITIAEVLRSNTDTVRKAFKGYAENFGAATDPTGNMFHERPDPGASFADAFTDLKKYAPVPKKQPKEGEKIVFGSGLGALQPYYERFVDPYVKSAAAKVPAIRAMLAREFVDRYSDQARFEKKAAGGSLPFDKSTYAGMRMYAGLGGKIETRLNQVADALRPLNDEKLLDAAMKYGELERHEELGARLPDYKMPDGRTPADAAADRAALEQQLGPDGLKKVQAGLAQYRTVMNDVMTEARDAGVISSEAYDSIVRGNEKYIPFDRVMAIADEYGGINAGQRAFSVASQDVYKPIKGSERAIANPIEASIRKLANTISLIERNKVTRTQANLANVPEFAGDIKRLPNTNRVPDGEKFSVLIDGLKVQYQAPREIVAAMKHMDVKTAGLAEKVARASAGMLRAGATELNPVFHVGNVIRDAQTATLATKGAFTPLDWAAGFAEAIKRGDLYREFQASGGGQGGVFLSKKNLPSTAKDLLRSKRSKVIRTVVNPVQLMRTIGQTFELAPRLGVYKMARNAGKNAPEAGFEARNATVDFSRSGNTMQIANMLVPFLNARLQGTLNQYKALGRDVKGAAAGQSKAKSAALLTYKLGMVAGLPLVATYLHNVQNFQKEWDSIDQQEKDKNFILIYGDGRDENGNLTQALKIPKGEIQALVNPTENFLEYMRDRDSKSLSRLALEMGSNLSPVPFEDKGEFSGRKVASAVIPPDIKAGAEWVTNQNIYTGRDIVPRGMEKATPSNQWDEKTPLIYRKAGEVTGLSPKKLENTVSTKLGGAGRYAAEAADAAFGDTGAPADTAGKMAKRFVGAYANAATTKDYEQLGEEDRAEADTRLTEERTAKGLIDEIKALPTDQRGARFEKAIESGEASPQVIKRMVAELKGASKNRFQESLRTRPVRERAQYIVNNLKRLPVEQRSARLQEFIESKVLNDGVAKEMATILSAPPPKRAEKVPTGTIYQ